MRNSTEIYLETYRNVFAAKRRINRTHPEANRLPNSLGIATAFLRLDSRRKNESARDMATTSRLTRRRSLSIMAKWRDGILTSTAHFPVGVITEAAKPPETTGRLNFDPQYMGEGWENKDFARLTKLPARSQFVRARN